jgi:hypothetical protein
VRRSLYALLAITCLLAAAIVGANTAAATPAAAAPASASNPCSDLTIYEPTPVHANPADDSGVIKTLPKDYGVTGPCIYIANSFSFGHWFMQVALASGGYGYIWVQRLAFGSHHQCNKGTAVQPIPSAQCELFGL